MAHVSGLVFGTSGKTGSKTSKTSLGAHLTRMAESHIEDDVSIELGMTADGEFEVVLRVGKKGVPRTLAKGNVRRLAAELRRKESRVEQL